MDQITHADLIVGSDLAIGSGLRPGTIMPATHYDVECFDENGNLRWQDGFDNIVVDAGLNDILNQYFKGSAYTAAFFVGLVGAGTGTVAINSAAAAVTGTGTSFAAGDARTPAASLLIVGAGASGADLSTTVSAFTSTTAITAGSNASTTVTGAAYAIDPRAADTMSSKSFNETAPYSNATRPSLTLGTVASKSVDNSASKAVFNINATGRIFGAFMATNSTVSGTTGTLYGGGLFAASRSVLSGDTLSVTITLTTATS